MALTIGLPGVITPTYIYTGVIKLPIYGGIKQCKYTASNFEEFPYESALFRVGKQWMFPKIVGVPPKSSILTGFSIINHPF